MCGTDDRNNRLLILLPMDHFKGSWSFKVRRFECLMKDFNIGLRKVLSIFFFVNSSSMSKSKNYSASYHIPKKDQHLTTRWWEKHMWQAYEPYGTCVDQPCQCLPDGSPDMWWCGGREPQCQDVIMHSPHSQYTHKQTSPGTPQKNTILWLFLLI